MKAQREIEEKEIEEKRKEDRERKKEKQKRQDRKPFHPEEITEWMINKEDAHVNNEIFQKYFQVQKPSLMYKVLNETRDKEKNTKLVNIFNSGLRLKRRN